MNRKAYKHMRGVKKQMSNDCFRNEEMGPFLREEDFLEKNEFAVAIMHGMGT